MSSEPLWMRYTDVGGYDELYRKGFETLKLYQPSRRLEIGANHEESRSVMEAPSQKVVRLSSKVSSEVSMKESVSFPYIKQEHLEQLTKIDKRSHNQRKKHI